MTKYKIPIDQLPNQSFEIELNDKRCRFEFITRGFSLYMNLSIDDVEKVNGIICLNNENLILYPEIGLEGKVYFTDTQGNLDPLFYGLNDRWLLVYEEE